MTDEIITIADKPAFQVDAALDPGILTAKSFPRNIVQCVQNVISIIKSDEDLASSCYYSLPPGKGQEKGFQGPSVRLADMFCYQWGNLEAGTRVVSNDGKQIVVEGFAYDLEKNNRISVQISKSILYKNGQTYTNTMQATTIAAAQAIAYRNAIFKVIPFMYIDKVCKMAMDEVASMAKNIEYVEKAIKSLEKYNVMPMQVLGYFNKQTLKELTTAEIQEMIGIGISLRDGHIASTEAFTRNATTTYDKDGVVTENGSRAEALLNMGSSE